MSDIEVFAYQVIWEDERGERTASHITATADIALRIAQTAVRQGRLNVRITVEHWKDD